jgi:hypothetical protein
LSVLLASGRVSKGGGDLLAGVSCSEKKTKVMAFLSTPKRFGPFPSVGWAKYWAAAGYGAGPKLGCGLLRWTGKAFPLFFLFKFSVFIFWFEFGI